LAATLLAATLLAAALLAATLLTATTTALFLAFALLAFTFLSLAISLLAPLLSWAARFARFVWILLSFHITFLTFRYYIVSLLILSRSRLDLVFLESTWKGLLD
jgi:hypothetical protein